MVTRDRLPSIGEEKPTSVFTPLLTGLEGGKMSSSNASSKIGVMDEEDVYYKINEAHCKPEDLEKNGVMEYAKYLVFPVLENWGENFEVQRKEKFGGDVTHDTYDELEDYFLGEHPEHMILYILMI